MRDQSYRRLWKTHDFSWTYLWGLKLKHSQLRLGREQRLLRLLSTDRGDRVHLLAFHLHQQALRLLWFKVLEKLELHLVDLSFLDHHLLVSFYNNLDLLGRLSI